MDSDVGVDLIKYFDKEGERVNTLIMDDNTTTLSKIRKDLDHTVSKWSDMNTYEIVNRQSLGCVEARTIILISVSPPNKKQINRQIVES